MPRAGGSALAVACPVRFQLTLYLLTSASSSVSWLVSLHLLGRYCQRLFGQAHGHPAADLSTATAVG